MSSKIYPLKIHEKGELTQGSDTVVEWTVWKKSSMSFVGSDGFSVYDGEGRLAFRVDNYSRTSKFLIGELLLMDAIGKPLISLRPQILSMYDEWKAYRGEGGKSKTKSKGNSKLFAMRRRSFSQKKDDVVEVFMDGGALMADFVIEGCFKKRSCRIRGREGEVLGMISPKNASPSVVLGDDVFSLFVKEGAATAELIMAFIVVMDRIC